jgi:CHC2 zinc finger.
MKNDYTSYREEIYDENDSVFYGRGKEKKYWNTDTNKYKAFENKKNTSIWTDTNYYDLMDGKWADMGRLLQLMKYCDSDNMLCVYDSHKKTMIPISTENQFMDLLDFKQRAWHDFKSKLDAGNIIKYITIADGVGNKNMRYFINPLITMRTREISTMTYKLFQEDLDQVLTPRAISNLRRHCAEMEELETNKSCVPINEEIAAQTAEEKESVFNEYILHDEPAKTYQKLGKGMVAHKMTLDNDTYFLVNDMVSYKPTKPKNEDITEYRSWYIDIDSGRDAVGNYFPLEEVARRKTKMLEVINALPIPTCITDTRNGYHIYYACYGVTDPIIWQSLEDKLISIVMIADPAVRDAARVLRLPGSNWIKYHTGLPPYPVTIQQANRQAYDAESFQRQMDTCADKVQASAKTYIDMYPNALTRVSNRKVVSAAIPIDCQNERIHAIMDLSDQTFTIPAAQEDVEDINMYLHQQINLADFLQIENPDSFCCILHNDKHPSASIYPNETGYRYYCASGACSGHGDGKGADIIDIVMAISGCNYKQALNYLSRIYNIRIKKVA